MSELDNKKLSENDLEKVIGGIGIWDIVRIGSGSERISDDFPVGDLNVELELNQLIMRKSSR